jgi:hypothetical protein
LNEFQTAELFTVGPFTVSGVQNALFRTEADKGRTLSGSEPTAN